MMFRLIQKLSFALITAILTTGSFAYSQQITGNVQDEESNPIPGVTIIIDGTDVGTTSDFDGNFSIDASDGDNLTFSFIGFQTQTVPVSQDFMTIVMSSEDTRLDEIIITGLGTSVKRRNLANAVGTVSSEELVGKTNQGTVDGALYGKIPGVNITSSSGAPGGGFALRLRGISSINGNNQPLFILDGVYLNNNEIPSGLRFASGANRGSEENAPNRIADLDPNDIENIEVLKGASAAAIYGTRANAGVIIITTKKGKAGKTKINLTQNLGYAEISNRLGMRDWTAASVEAAFGAGEVAKYNAAVGSFGLIDYEDEIYGNRGIISDTKLSVSGGNDKTQFYVGTSYRDEEGIIKLTGFDRSKKVYPNISNINGEIINFNIVIVIVRLLKTFLE